MTALLATALLVTAPAPPPPPSWLGLRPLAITCRGTQCRAGQMLPAYCPEPWKGQTVVADAPAGTWRLHCDGVSGQGAHYRWDLMATPDVYVTVAVPPDGSGPFYKLVVVGPDDYHLENDYGVRTGGWTRGDEAWWIQQNRRLFE